MSTNTKIFHPTPIKETMFSHALDLDFATPRGLFLSDSGHRYIVCDDRKRRFAVALDHPDYEPFTYLPLRQQPVDRGRWAGVGEFRLDRLADYTAKQMFTGMLRVGDGFVSLFLQDRRDRYALKPVAQGSGGHRDRLYEHWTLMAGGERFFRYRIGQHPPFIAWD